MDYVCSDNAAGAELGRRPPAAQRLSALWLAQPPSFHLGRPHARGSVSAGRCKRAEWTSNATLAILACQQEGYAGGLQAAALADEALEGIFCANAQLACGFLDGMRQRGREAPGGFQLIGFDNTPDDRAI
ncbi:LacI family transcriptional regulator [Klebsiella pneumoniae]|uniref:LacI family transcriptional regulator n=1 Tax=Klebsiella pneumoniae TaxID=573 RepID=A0A378FQL3_KLEPN|nr:LacI family transcriptional regulator [Klebsiella pneumoniae]